MRRWSVIFMPFSMHNCSIRDSDIFSPRIAFGRLILPDHYTPIRPDAKARGAPREIGSAFTPRLGAQADLLGQVGAVLGVIGRHHGIIGGKAPTLAVFLGRHVVGRVQMALQHLQFLAVFQADDIVREHGFFRRHGRFGALCLLRSGPDIGKRVENLVDQIRNVPRRGRIIADMGGDDFRGQFDSKYAAIYYPWIKVFDPNERFSQGTPPKQLVLPPSGFVTGIYARNDITRGVHKAPANEIVRGLTQFEVNINNLIQNITILERKMTKTDNNTEKVIMLLPHYMEKIVCEVTSQLFVVYAGTQYLKSDISCVILTGDFSLTLHINIEIKTKGPATDLQDWCCAKQFLV